MDNLHMEEKVFTPEVCGRLSLSVLLLAGFGTIVARDHLQKEKELKRADISFGLSECDSGIAQSVTDSPLQGRYVKKIVDLARQASSDPSLAHDTSVAINVALHSVPTNSGSAKQLKMLGIKAEPGYNYDDRANLARTWWPVRNAGFTPG